jgi:tetratricopeptide (TPR) repeat protein
VTYNNVGILMHLMKRYDAALQSCAQALRLNPNEGTFYYNLARLLASLGKPQEALQAYRTAQASGFRE